LHFTPFLITISPAQKGKLLFIDSTLFLVADYANLTNDGKLNVMGIFTRLMATGFPTTHPEMFLVSQVTASPAEYGRPFKLAFKLLDEDAKPLVDIGFDQVVPHGQAGEEVNINTLVRLNNVVFPKPGAYEFSVLVDWDVKQTLSIQVVQHNLPVPPPATLSPN
jgi:hypothetical protein